MTQFTYLHVRADLGMTSPDLGLPPRFCCGFLGLLRRRNWEIMSQYDELKRLLDSESGERDVVKWLKHNREIPSYCREQSQRLVFRISS